MFGIFVESRCEANPIGKTDSHHLDGLRRWQLACPNARQAKGGLGVERGKSRVMRALRIEGEENGTK